LKVRQVGASLVLTLLKDPPDKAVSVVCLEIADTNPVIQK